MEEIDRNQHDALLCRQRQPPVPAYFPSPRADDKLYGPIQASPRRLLSSDICPPRSGLAVRAPATSIIRISTPSGPQVCDLNVFSQPNAAERFWAARTRQLHASHLTKGDRLWSNLPYLRPLATIVHDSLAGYGKDKYGSRCHDLLGTRCDPYVNRLLSGRDYDFHCHSNLTRAVMQFGLQESDVHDVINLFQVTGLDEQGRYTMSASPARKGECIELFAEQDLLIAISACPGGDLSLWGWGTEDGDGKDMKEVCRELQVEVFEVTDKAALQDWSPPERPAYGGLHGMKVPRGEAQE
ncbi:hypothetical protein K461DRAFT_273302 [Myriangium duriaei CBS 260.36]|uniref:DUF1989 domain-containing protein n=1 Tax=Myriangium duriaei CBS 260.36 TaxID=1168546 RepID=A0A9P4J880_9PEZI|nr:hypothetical protein K461DRAFT_273302 [Myriangium duriaei CBS 260.36]